MQDITASVLGVSGRTTKSGTTVFDVALSDGQKYSTFKPDLANKANALTGQVVAARVNVTQNGKYTNYNLEDIAPQGQLPPMAMPQPAGTPIPISAASSSTGGGSGGGGWTPEKEQRVTRLSALGTAFEFVSTVYSGAGAEALQEAEEKAFALAKRLYVIGYTGQPQEAAVAAPAPQTPSEVAEQVNGQVEGAVQVGPPQADVVPR